MFAYECPDSRFSQFPRQGPRLIDTDCEVVPRVVMLGRAAALAAVAAGLALGGRAPAVVVDCTDRTGRSYDGIGGLSNRCALLQHTYQ